MNTDEKPSDFIVMGDVFRIEDVWTERIRWDGSPKECKAMVASFGGEWWLCRQHCDGQWVTVRKATENDMERARSAAKE